MHEPVSLMWMVVSPLSLCAVNECVHPSCSVKHFYMDVLIESSLSILATLCSPSLHDHLSASNIYRTGKVFLIRKLYHLGGFGCPVSKQAYFLAHACWDGQRELWKESNDSK